MVKQKTTKEIKNTPKQIIKAPIVRLAQCEVIVGSTNKCKIQAVVNAIQYAKPAYKTLGRPLNNVKVRGVTVDTGVSEQPLGLEITLKGALNRAKKAYKQR